MKIAVCVSIDITGAGGVETHIRQLTQSLRDMGTQVDIYGKNALSPEQFHYQDYDIIHTHGCGFPTWMFAFFLKRKARQRHIHTLHGTSPGYLSACRCWLNWRCYNGSLIEYCLSRYADHVIAVSKHTARSAHRCFGVNYKKMTIIANGYTSHNMPVDTRAEIRKKLGLNAENLVILFVGRGLDQVKGTKLITSALNKIYPRYPHIRLLAIPGDGFGKAPWLIRTGPVPHEEIYRYYGAADAFVNASLYEGMPLTVIEAMGAGLAIVAAPVGGIPERIEHNHNGLLLHPNRANIADCLERLITSGTLRGDFARKAHHQASQLTWSHIARETQKLYETVLSR